MRLIEKAKELHPNLKHNETVCVKTNGQLRARKVIFVNPPISSGAHSSKDQNLKVELQKCYQQIFTEFAHTARKGQELAVPCFSTGKGHIDSDWAAQIATEEAIKFLQKHKDKKYKVSFVCFEGDRDKQNLKAYQKVLQAAQKEVPGQINLKEGRIEDEAVDAIVCPIQEDFDLEISGPTAKAICQKADEAEQVTRDIHELGTRDRYNDRTQQPHFQNPRMSKTVEMEEFESDEWDRKLSDSLESKREKEEIDAREAERASFTDLAESEAELKEHTPIKEGKKSANRKPASRSPRKKRTSSIDENEGL